jgi:hypothetical protein
VRLYPVTCRKSVRGAISPRGFTSLENPSSRDKRICLLPRETRHFCCTDGSHDHVNRIELADAIEHNLAIWIQFPRRKQRGIARRLRIPPVRGLSAKVGGTLAEDMSDKALSDIAKSMYANIRCKRESGSLSSYAPQAVN